MRRWDSPHIRSDNPDARDRVPWYDSTPGFAPSCRGRKIPVGAIVRVLARQHDRVHQSGYQDGYALTA
ncbi:hypothetical protein [Nonomuraea basaltis]|uniref:hypothetical protein n=1 Tax=Nonomuraea basaltis TaxID=2495887 RepID=UPI00110C3F96|nr:hypothetical protein [Nonomuraea basaltis]TMR97714.1 hypothetical protein EJK15_16900 [Nonomuraea basaltis]